MIDAYQQGVPASQAMGRRTPGPITSAGGGRRTIIRGPVGLDEQANGPAATTERFKQAVFDRQLANARASGRPYFPAVSEGELVVVEGGFKLRKAAAQDCVALVAAARADLAIDRRCTRRT